MHKIRILWLRSNKLWQNEKGHTLTYKKRGLLYKNFASGQLNKFMSAEDHKHQGLGVRYSVKRKNYKSDRIN